MPSLSKQKEFNAKMGKHKKFPKHLDLSKGGMVDKRKHFDDGGGVAGNTTQSTAGSNGLGFGSGSVFTPAQGLYDPQGFTNEIGGVANGISAAFTSQNGYQAQLAPTTQFNYAPTVGAASETALNPGAVNGAIGAEENLASQYGDIAAGRGPNPAATMLNEETGKNVANTAATMAGQRGSSANAGLIAREAAQQGAATQQQAVGQGATMQANQQLGALGAQGTLQNQIANQGLGEQGVGANVYASAAGANNAQNANTVNNYAQAQGLNQSTAQSNADATNKTMGGLLGGVGSVLSILNKGGEVEKFDAGGPVINIAPMPGAQPTEDASGPSLGVDTSMPNPENSTIATGTLTPDTHSTVGDIVRGAMQKHSDNTSTDPKSAGFASLGKGIGGLFAGGGNVCPGPHKSHVANFLYAEGGNTEKVPALVSANEVYLNPRQVQEVVERGADPMKIGQHFPGKDRVKHNSIKNDVIPTELEDGGVVVPIDITTHKDASEKARQFVVKAHAKRYLKKPKGMKNA